MENKDFNIITIEHVGKMYMINHNAKKHLGFKGRLKLIGKTIIHPSTRYHKEEFWALKDISFTVKQGEKVGIIGKNGAGKSTLLKILSRITEPTKGKIEMYGKVSSMLEVGTGFNAELTGRENVYLNGAILGMTKAEVDAKFDAIVEFSEVGKFIDTPVKRYSSGMFVRLAFAVASNLDPDILIVDEVLSVGDTKFQRKCITRMMNIAESGKTILYVSHQMQTIRQLCDRVIVLKEGNIIFDGDVEDGIDIYSDAVDVNTTFFDLSDHKDRGSQQARILDVEILGHETGSWVYDEDINLRIHILANDDLTDVSVDFILRDLNLKGLGKSSSANSVSIKRGEDYYFDINIHDCRIAPGKYIGGIELVKNNGELSSWLDIVPEAFVFEILSEPTEEDVHSKALPLNWNSRIWGSHIISPITISIADSKHDK